MIKRLLLLAALLPLVAVGQAKNCDRACLESFVDRYLDALIAHDPQKLPMTPRVKNTEDGVRLDLGDGLWRTVLGKGTYRLFVADTNTGQVVFIGTMQEGRTSAPKPIILAVRLKIDNGRVSEIETLVVRNNQAGANLEKLGSPNAVFQASTPPAQRAARADLVAVANMYLSGIEKNDGKRAVPFAEECQRIQNGNQTTNNSRTSQLAQLVAGTDGRPAAAVNPAPAQLDIGALSCSDQFKLGYFNFIQRVRDRRFAVVDQERGLVAVIAEMDEPAGPYATFKLTDGRDITAGPDFPRTIAFFEIYKVEGGKIRRIEAAQHDVPYGMLSGWSSYEDGMSGKARMQ